MALGVGFLGPVQLRKGPPPCQDTPSILGHPCCHSVFCRRVLGYSSCFRGVEGLGGSSFTSSAGALYLGVGIKGSLLCTQSYETRVEASKTGTPKGSHTLLDPPRTQGQMGQRCTCWKAQVLILSHLSQTIKICLMHQPGPAWKGQ